MVPIRACARRSLRRDDLVPALHARRGAGAAAGQLALVLAAVATIAAVGAAGHGAP